jgi:hypothetical protein
MTSFLQRKDVDDEKEWGLKGYENITKSVQLRKMADQTALKYVI